MIRLALAFVMLATLAACGVDGPPKRPKPDAEASISGNGDVRFGLRAGQGPVSVSVSL